MRALRENFSKDPDQPLGAPTAHEEPISPALVELYPVEAVPKAGMLTVNLARINAIRVQQVVWVVPHLRDNLQIIILHAQLARMERWL